MLQRPLAAAPSLLHHSGTFPPFFFTKCSGKTFAYEQTSSLALVEEPVVMDRFPFLDCTDVRACVGQQ